MSKLIAYSFYKNVCLYIIEVTCSSIVGIIFCNSLIFFPIIVCSFGIFFKMATLVKLSSRGGLLGYIIWFVSFVYFFPLAINLSILFLCSYSVVLVHLSLQYLIKISLPIQDSTNQSCTLRVKGLDTRFATNEVYWFYGLMLILGRGGVSIIVKMFAFL